MDYNNMFPMGYQPRQMYYPQQNQNNNSITWVQGLEAAKSYLVAPNTTVQLWDSEAQTIYLKSADASGMPSMKIIDYTIRSEGQNKTSRDEYSEFATKVDVESIRKEIEALSKRVDLMTEKGSEVNV
jgi:hypothetical protein